MRDLVDMSPSLTDDGAVITATRRATIYMLDGASGTVMRVFQGPGSDGYGGWAGHDPLDIGERRRGKVG